MSKNDEDLNNISLRNKNQKLLETEKRLINEGIIFKSRLINNKKEKKNITKRNNNIKNSYKNLSIKLTEKNIRKENNNINNIPFNSKKPEKLSISKIILTSMDESSKDVIKKNYSHKNKLNKKLKDNNCNKSMNILKPRSFKIFNNHSQKSSINYINSNFKNIINSGIVSPRISFINKENRQVPPLDISKYYINRDIDYPKFNYKKWNKITINNIFNKEINNVVEENSNIILNKENLEKNDDITENEKNQNYKKQKKINNIPLNRKKNKSKECLNERNNIFNYCKHMTNLALSKENNSNFIRQTINKLKSEKTLKVDNLQEKKKNNIQLNNNIIKRSNKSFHEKYNSIDRISNEIIPISQQNSLKEFDFKNEKIYLPKNKYTNKEQISSLQKYISNNFSLNKKKRNKFENINKICRNDFYVYKENSIPKLNTQIIKIKNNSLIDYIKTEETNNIKSNKDIIFNNDENKNKEDKIDIKKELYENGNEENFNSNTDLFTEKDNIYSFDNKIEIDKSESSVKIFHSSYKNILDNNISVNKINKYPYTLKHNVFTKKKVGCVNIKTNNNKINDENKENKNLNLQNYNDNNNIQNDINIKRINKIDEKKIVFKNKKENQSIDTNMGYGGNYLELAKICANQEKIISDLVKNVQKLNSQICNKDLCINELNSQLYSIKYDLLNTLQKTNNNQ